MTCWPGGWLTYVRQMTTELQAHSKALEEQTTKSARDVAILNEKDQEYARQGQAKSKEVCAILAAIEHMSSSLLGVIGVIAEHWRGFRLRVLSACPPKPILGARSAKFGWAQLCMMLLDLSI